VTDCTRVPIRL